MVVCPLEGRRLVEIFETKKEELNKIEECDANLADELDFFEKISNFDVEEIIIEDENKIDTTTNGEHIIYG